MSQAHTTLIHSYDGDIDKCKRFLSTYKSREKGHKGELKYEKILQSVSNRECSSVVIDLDDVEEFDSELRDAIESNARRYVSVMSEAVASVLPAPTKTLLDVDIYDVLLSQRMDIGNDEGNRQGQSFPNEMIRRYDIRFAARSALKPNSIREIRANEIGHLVSVKGLVTRVSEVKPMVRVATYMCDVCGFEIYQQVDSHTFMPMSECPSKVCRGNSVKGNLTMMTRGFVFAQFQEVKIQEMSDQVPIGHIPRTMTCHIRNDRVRKVKPGNVVTFSGIFLSTPFVGFKRQHTSLLTDTYLEVLELRQEIESFAQLTVTPQMMNEIRLASKSDNVYQELANSIAPEIYGHEDVKKALLLQMVGGVGKTFSDGMRVRGDLNICLMGDPGVAKSQLLKHISYICPRSIYSTGKGSSGVGLTAAVVRDPTTFEMSLEGGALVLADNGICCIDEFDKIEEGDRTALHEVMEQQTLSIAKAGITTTLNARTSVLAAANPSYGRYNPKKSPSENINLPAALLSRFDLMFLILDKPDLAEDLKLAKHITYVHKNKTHPPLDFTPIRPEVLRAFIAMAKKYEPTLTVESSQYLVQQYIEIRSVDKTQSHDDHTKSIITPRQLLSIVRLSQALARLRFSNIVEVEDISEAVRIIDMSKSSVYDDQSHEVKDVPTRIYRIIRDYVKRMGKKEAKLDELKNVVFSNGYTDAQFEECVRLYSESNVWQKIRKGMFLMFTES